MTLLDHTIITERYFFPRPDAPRGLWIVDGLACARRTKDRAAALLHFHGNGEVVADWLGDFARSLDAGGVDAYFAEYRGYGASSGTPSLSALLDDALTVFDAMERAPTEVVVYGRSIGSLAAAHVAAHRDVKALVLESGICDLAERLLVRVTPEEVGATEEELRAAIEESFDQEAKIARAKCPVLVLHAENDHMVKKHHAERNAKAAGSRADLVMYPMGDHNTIHAFNGEDIVRRVVDVATTTARRPGS
jgi:alpha-beta hydrolase superfamily lysophospholipase